MRALTLGLTRFRSEGVTSIKPLEGRQLRRAAEMSHRSPDPSTKTGAVIFTPRGRILSADFNHFPAGLAETPERLNTREVKYDYIGHAERNAIYSAARRGVALDGSVIAVNWFPCIDCAKAIISSGIKTVVGFVPDYQHERWGEQFRKVKSMLDEAQIKLRLFTPEQIPAAKA